MLPTLSALATRLGAGTTSAVALTEDALARAADPAGEGARVYLHVDAEGARRAAAAADLLRPGAPRSAIDGLPISVKDLFDVAGQTTRAGSVVLADAAPAARHAEVVQRLRAAGAVIVGRTNMTEFAYSGLGLNPHHGTPRNPWDRATGRIPGGSSSGAAVSVSDGMAAAAIGSDTGGSVRIPAAFCGLTGFKPTARRVSMAGVLPLSRRLDSVGPIAPSVACCAALDAILSGEDPAGTVPPPALLRGLRLAVPTTVALDALQPAVAGAFAAALSKLSAAGAAISEIAVTPFAELAGLNTRGGLIAAEAYAWHRDLLAREQARYDPRVALRMLRGREMSAVELLDLLDARLRWTAEVEAAIGGFDALLMPTIPIVAPPLAELEASDALFGETNLLVLRNPSFINFLDGCALSLPCHREGEAPVGLMVAGAGGRDRRILAIGLAVEAALRA